MIKTPCLGKGTIITRGSFQHAAPKSAVFFYMWEGTWILFLEPMDLSAVKKPTGREPCFQQETWGSHPSVQCPGSIFREASQHGTLLWEEGCPGWSLPPNKSGGHWAYGVDVLPVAPSAVQVRHAGICQEQENGAASAGCRGQNLVPEMDRGFSLPQSSFHPPKLWCSCGFPLQTKSSVPSKSRQTHVWVFEARYPVRAWFEGTCKGNKATSPISPLASHQRATRRRVATNG